MLAHYQDCTGLSAEQVRLSLLPPQDIWLSAQEALALNVCDVISSAVRQA